MLISAIQAKNAHSEANAKRSDSVDSVAARNNELTLASGRLPNDT